MNLDKNQLKTVINQSKSVDLLVLSVDSLNKDSNKIAFAEMAKFMKNTSDYTIAVIKK